MTRILKFSAMNIRHKFTLLLFGLGLCTSLFAQNLQYETGMEIKLNDGTAIMVYRGGSTGYYYLPPASSMHLGMKEDQTPEFVFMKFTTEARETQGGVQGAILHFLIEWGLTPAQLTELEEKIKQKSPLKNNATLAGPVDLRAKEGESFRVVSAILQDKKFTTNFITSGYAPPMQGGKAAVAARLDANGAQLLDATFKKTSSITDVSLVLDYEYTVKVKAAKGYLKYDLEITHEQGDGMAYDFMRKELDNRPQDLQKAINMYEANKKKLANECGVADGMGNMLIAMQAMDAANGNTSGSGDTGSPWEYGVTESMMRKVYEYFEQKEKIILRWEENLDDERLNVMREAFFGFFLNSFAEPVMPEFNTVIAAGDGFNPATNNPVKDEKQASYQFKSCTQMESNRVIKKEIRLDHLVLPVTRRYQMVTNLASSYDMVRNNPKCISSVNLNDPFFQHRDINFILDLEAQEIFSKEINHVTVNVRKRRTSGNSFEDAITFTNDFMQENGSLATITYARGEDRNPDLYEYKAQWSLKGGNLYPQNPAWVKGDWQGVTLAPPVKPRKIEFECDLDELREIGIVRATLQVRYSKFGKEVEENIPITVSKNEPLVDATIYEDRDAQGYVSRLVLTHKEHGKLALDWEANVNDDYVYASIPDELREGDQTFLQKVMRAGKEVLTPKADGTVDPQTAILDKFAKVLGIFLGEE